MRVYFIYEHNKQSSLIGGREGVGNAERPERTTEVAREGCPGTG